VVDLGTGDGRAVLRAARRDTRILSIGIDADAASMRDSSRKAARSKGGAPNALFVVSAVESLPEDLTAIADEVRIAFPWGSLLLGVLGHGADVLAGIARAAKPGAPIRALLSVTERDGVGVTTDVDAAAYEAHGLRLVEARPAAADEVAAADSSWAKRLRAGVDRPVTSIRAVRVDD
jgi:16S rRNA (adenine(1408)-N(1))-methyltransferase